MADAGCFGAQLELEQRAEEIARYPARNRYGVEHNSMGCLIRFEHIEPIP